ncbi:MAG: hypothetical protein GX620_16710 [Chloroflexi bacterium]|nr:hypothetical protein [Chloroflexota bacterium]
MIRNLTMRAYTSLSTVLLDVLGDAILLYMSAPNRARCRCEWILAAVLLIPGLLSACAPQIVTVTVTSPPETVVVTVTPAPTAVPAEPSTRALSVCVVGEPDTLYLYGGSMLSATRHVMAALYDGPLDYVDFEYHPVILTKLPSVADGDAVIKLVRVHAGDRVVDSQDRVVELAEGDLIRPRGCYAHECAIQFDGQPLFMERMEATFALKDGLKWSDGEPLTAADSVFAYRVASDQFTPVGHDLAERTLEYRALDDLRVKWTGLPGFIRPDYATYFFAPLPAHQLKGRSASSLLRDGETRRDPLTWGPFMVGEWAPGDHLTVTRNPHYFRASDGLPVLDYVVFKFATDASQVVARVVAGDCDVGVESEGFVPLAPVLSHLEAQGLVRMLMAEGDVQYRLDFGMDPQSGYRQEALFGDVRVRRGIIQCVDRATIVEEVAFGIGDLVDGPLPSRHPLSGNRLMQWGYDPAAGRALLEDAGWLDEDQDGLLEAIRVEGVRRGTVFQVKLIAPADDTAARHSVSIIQANLLDCGVRVEPDYYSVDDLVAPGSEGPLFGRRFDLALTLDQVSETLDCTRYLSTRIPSEGLWHAPNVTGYSSAEYDASCLRAVNYIPGMVEYRAQYGRIQNLLAEDLPSIPLFTVTRLAIARPDLVGLTLDATSLSELWNIESLAVQ